MRANGMESKLQLDRLYSYVYRISGKIAGINQDVAELIISKALLEQVEQALKSSDLETVAFIHGKVKGKKLIATDALIPSKRDYEKRTWAHLQVLPQFIIREFPKLERQGKTLLATVHSHSIDGLSAGDVATHIAVAKHYPHQLTGVYNGKFLFYRLENGIKPTPYKAIDTSRFDRQIKMLGETGQLLISSTTIAMIGVGGNAKLAFDLASLGIGKLILIDPDKWEEHNRNRIFIPPTFIGRNKAESVKELIEQYYPDVRVEAYSKKAEEISDEIYSNSDILIVGPDTITTRIFGNRLALKLKKPAIFPGARIESQDGKLAVIGGSVQVVTADSPCYECISAPSQLDLMRETLDSETKKRLSQKYGLGDKLDIPSAPAIASLNDVIAGVAIWEIIKLVTGIEQVTSFQIYDALKSTLKPVQIIKDQDCPGCAPQLPVEPKIETKDSEELLSALQKEGV